ncbi:flagellar basal body protein FliL [Clostridium niameyense]|uniref:Flagellar protein FliL n=1 Tax=Clostridium niameyense TaxID=1622073 RepID=A0A6M0R885_9CLOT|nr:flagellar basal body-associated FliL family protein [Clostridium niameyense]NEZ45900.1 flagellar basal body protein FliL [Clostridium niameyense]
MSEKSIEKQSGKSKKIIIIVLAILVIAAGGFGGYMIFQKQKAPKRPVAVPQQNAQIASQQTSNGVYPPQIIVSSKNYSLDEFLVNLTDEDGKRYLKAKVFVGYDEKKLDKELEEKKPILRDAVITILRSKKAKDITPKGVDQIKTEIITKVNPMLQKGQITSIYFDDLLLQ